LTQKSDIARIIDANLNRSREGARVLEEVARFIMNDEILSGKIKEIRHQIVETCRNFGFTRDELLDARDSEVDVGRHIEGNLEKDRAGINDVIASNFARIEEALRTIEEFGKIINSDAAFKIKDLRYEIYTLEKVFRLNKQK
jgi:thiamine-phosphate pyrophosphorylase